MKLITILLLVLLLPLTTILAQNDRASTGKNYYVSMNGDDVNDGTSWENAFATLQHAENVLESGDTVFVANGSYAGVYIDVEGTENSPIIFKATGDDVKITSDNQTTPDGINIENAAWITIDGFVVNERTRAGIRVVLSDHITIRNNTCLRNGKWGIFTGFAPNIMIEKNECAYSEIEHGIYHSNSADNPIIRNNICHHNNANGIHINGDISLGGDGMISNAKIYSNIIYENGTAGGSGINCDGISNSAIYNNLIYENHASGISLYKIDAAAGSTNNKIYNNTIINASDGRWCLNIRNGSNDNMVYNNILINQHSWRGAITLDASVTSLTTDHNVMTNKFTTNDGESTTDLAGWQALNYDEHSMIAGGLDELFVNTEGQDYQLKETAIAIDKGTDDVSNTVKVDIVNGKRPANDLFDIGCYEFNAEPSEGGSGEEVITHSPVAEEFAIWFENPMTDHYQLNLMLPSSSLVSLNLIDSQGQAVETIVQGTIGKGIFSVPLDKSVIKPGFYLLTGTINQLRIEARPVIIR